MSGTGSLMCAYVKPQLRLLLHWPLYSLCCCSEQAGQGKSMFGAV